MLQKCEHSIIRKTPNYRETVLGKCRVFQERVPRDLRHPILSQCKDLEDEAKTKAGVEVSDKDIENCHQVGKRGQTIVKFCKRKVSKQILNVRKNLTKLSIENLQLTGQVKLSVNQSLCLNYRVL